MKHEKLTVIKSTVILSYYQYKKDYKVNYLKHLLHSRKIRRILLRNGHKSGKHVYALVLIYLNLLSSNNDKYQICYAIDKKLKLVGTDTQIATWCDIHNIYSKYKESDWFNSIQNNLHPKI